MKHLETNELNQILDQMITPMMLTDEANAPGYFNHAFQSQFGYTIDQVPDQNSLLKKAYPNPGYRIQVMEAWDEALAAARKRGDTSPHLVSKICCADGVFRWFDVHQHMIGTKRAFTFLNVDELKKHSEDLADTVKIKESQLCIIAHDVRSPLSCIKQIVNSYERVNLPERDIEDLFFKLGNQVDHVFNIVNSLLMRVSDERGRFIAYREPINLRNFFSKYSVYYNERLRSKRIGLVLELPEDTVLHYDPGILDVICRNLLDNAIKFTGNNGTIHISFKRMVGHTKLFIRDTGKGMSPEQVEQILGNKGSRKVPKRVTDGFGLGLLFAKELLEKYNGRLSVKSRIGEGTSFIIDITDHFLN